MNRKRFATSLSWMGAGLWRSLAGILAAGVFLLSGSAAHAAQAAAAKKPAPANAISTAQFSRMVQDFSEEEGSFASDNYISNETTYLEIVDKMKELGVSGGAYIGVGPEQNFTYIAKIRPQIAFIMDIRRQAIIQHLMYKAIFHLAANRTQFLSLLFSKPVVEKDAPGGDATIEALTAYFNQAPTSEEAYAKNLAAIRKTIEKDFEIPFRPGDQQMLEKVYGAFQEANLHIYTRWSGGGGGGYGYGGFPTLRDILVQKDPSGEPGGFLATNEDYDFLRDLNRRNRIIPVVGDFAGSKALSTIAGYLKENGYTVSAYYTSNVEQYLFGDGVFGAFAKNVAKLPASDKSVFIRSVRPGFGGRGGYSQRTVLQKIPDFLKDNSEGLYVNYRRFTSTHFITADDSSGN